MASIKYRMGTIGLITPLATAQPKQRVAWAAQKLNGVSVLQVLFANFVGC